MIILLPPSEGKEPGGKGVWTPENGRFGGALAAPRQRVVASLPRTPGAALKVRGAHAEHAQRANQSLGASPALPARVRYSGVVYQGLDYNSLSAKERRKANSSIVVVSGLAGMVAFGDDLPDYRAPIDSRVASLGKLSQFWKPELQPVLEQLSRRHIIVDVLPQAHRAAMSPVGDWRTVEIVDKSGAGGHAAKHAKGRFVRWLLNHDPDEIGAWRDGGWRAVVR